MCQILKEQVEAWQAGDAGAALAVLQRFAGMAARLAAPLVEREGTVDAGLVEDAMQESCVIALEKIRTLRDPEAFAAWYRNIVRTAARTVRPRGGGRDVPFEEGAMTTSRTPTREALDAELRRAVEEAIAGLPPATREATRMRVLDGLEYRLIAERLHAPVGTVRRRVHEGRARVHSVVLRYVHPSRSGFGVDGGKMSVEWDMRRGGRDEL